MFAIWHKRDDVIKIMYIGTVFLEHATFFGIKMDQEYDFIDVYNPVCKNTIADAIYNKLDFIEIYENRGPYLPKILRHFFRWMKKDNNDMFLKFYKHFITNEHTNRKGHFEWICERAMEYLNVCLKMLR